ncbi:hypothetical protein [Nocardia phage NS-I]|nr:hypothetical protein [Nocardia phage NS-I]
MTHDAVNYPSHYTSHPSGIECLQITRGLPFTLGNAVKYVWRADLKNGLEDLRKASFYLQDWMGYEETDTVVIPSYTAELLSAVETAEVEIYGSDHPRPCFFHFIGRGLIDRALAEVEAMIEDQEIGLPL